MLSDADITQYLAILTARAVRDQWWVMGSQGPEPPVPPIGIDFNAVLVEALEEVRALRALVAGNPAAPRVQTVTASGPTTTTARWRRTVGMFAGDPPGVGDIDAPHILGTPPDHARPVDNEWRRKTMGAYGVADTWPGPDAPQRLILVNTGCRPERGWWLRVAWEAITAWHNPGPLSEGGPSGAYEARCTWLDRVLCSPLIPETEFTFWLGADLPMNTLCSITVRGYNTFMWVGPWSTALTVVPYWLRDPDPSPVAPTEDAP